MKDEAAGMKGQSLVAWLRGKNRKDLDSLVETFYPRENFGWSELVGLISGRWKYIQSPRPELYDLKSDPGEREDLYAVFGRQGRRIEEEAGTGASRLERRRQAGKRANGRQARGPGTAQVPGLRELRSGRRGDRSLPDPKEKIPLLRLIQQAQAYELEDNYAEAEKVYLRVLEDVPDSPAGYVNLAIAQARQKKFDQALRTLNNGIARIPDSEILLVRLGHTYLVTGMLREAFETMNKVLDLNPRNVDALTVCAGILDTEGRKEEARGYYDRALAVEPESRYLRMSYAGNLASSGRLREAIEVYKKLIDDFPEEQGFYQYVGIAYSYLGEFDQAISFLERALAIRPTPTGYFNLAVAYEKSGNIREAVKNFKLYLDNSRGESETNIRKAKAELERLGKGS